MNGRGVFGLLAVVAHLVPVARAATWERDDLGFTTIVPMRYAPYPHASREGGFKVGDKIFPRDPHYSDSSVAVFIPRHFRPSGPVHLLFYFHGHNNNIRRSLREFRLREQVVAGGKNVVLVFPEGPKNVGDSGGGKLEEKDGLKRLAEEVTEFLAAEGKVSERTIGRVALAGHSGAYRVISFCVEQGGLEKHIAEVCLLDATYARLDAFVDWAARSREGRLFSIFTDHLAGENVYLMTRLRRRDLSYELMDEDDAADALLRSTRLLFVNTTKLTHDQTVQWLERWLRASSLPMP